MDESQSLSCSANSSHDKPILEALSSAPSRRIDHSSLIRHPINHIPHLLLNHSIHHTNPNSYCCICLF